MAFDIAIWKTRAGSELVRLADEAARSAPDEPLSELVLALGLVPLLEAFTQERSTAINVAFQVLADGNTGELITAMLAAEAPPRVAAATLARGGLQGTLRQEYATIITRLGLVALAEEHLVPYPRLLQVLRDELMCWPDLRCDRGPPAAAQGGVSFAEGSQLGQVGDIVGGHKVAGDQTIGKSAKRDLIESQINIHLGGDAHPPEPLEVLVGSYLDALIRDCALLTFSHISGRSLTGNAQDVAPSLPLEQIFTTLTTDGKPVVVDVQELEAEQLRQQIIAAGLAQCDGRTCRPEEVRLIRLTALNAQQHVAALLGADEALATLAAAGVRERFLMEVVRPELVSDVVEHNDRLVFLGDPGAGKSTLLRFVAYTYARRCAEALASGTLPSRRAPLPVICHLGRMAHELPRHKGDPSAALNAVIAESLEGRSGLRPGLGRGMRPALRDGGVILLCDGLDELPMGQQGEAGQRELAAAALRELGKSPHIRILVTSRIGPYREKGDWKLARDDGWEQRVIQPLSFGQVRHYVSRWYDALAIKTGEFTAQAARERAAALLRELDERAFAGPLVRSPLLLTMVTILHYNKDRIPFTRALLYDECVQLLVERWEAKRSPEQPGLGLRQQLNLPDLDLTQLRHMLHELAFKAHDQPPGGDGRGLIDRKTLYGHFYYFFKSIRAPNPNEMAQLLLEAPERNGTLLGNPEDHRYAFPHLSIQEYLAACHLADQVRGATGQSMEDLAYTRWAGPDSERWREVLLLLMGRLQQQGQKAIISDALPWLRRLIEPGDGKARKSKAAHLRDIALASQSYEELGGRASLAFFSRTANIRATLEAPLARAIVTLLRTPNHAVRVEERIMAARVLGSLGDTRLPVSIRQWAGTVARLGQGRGAGHEYWRAVEGGTYAVGGWGHGQRLAQVALGQFWIARFVLTVAQYQDFARDDGKAQGYPGANLPWRGASWYEASAFAAHLTGALSSVLPEGLVVRLPTEAEWEVAAVCQGDVRHTYPWGETAPTSEHAIYGRDEPAPVGCCPAGRAPCGALDMLGNVWEWTTSSFRGYPLASHILQKFTDSDFDVALRGGPLDAAGQVSTAVRSRHRPSFKEANCGVRLVIARTEPTAKLDRSRP